MRPLAKQKAEATDRLNPALAVAQFVKHGEQLLATAFTEHSVIFIFDCVLQFDDAFQCSLALLREMQRMGMPVAGAPLEQPASLQFIGQRDKIRALDARHMGDIRMFPLQPGDQKKDGCS